MCEHCVYNKEGGKYKEKATFTDFLYIRYYY